MTANFLDKMISDLDIVAQIAVAIPGAAPFAILADKLLQVAQASVRAHEATTGKPLDLSLLHHIEPVV